MKCEKHGYNLPCWGCWQEFDTNLVTDTKSAKQTNQAKSNFFSKDFYAEIVKALSPLKNNKSPFEFASPNLDCNTDGQVFYCS